MSAFSGPQGRRAMRKRREEKMLAAHQRQTENRRGLCKVDPQRMLKTVVSRV